MSDESKTLLEVILYRLNTDVYTFYITWFTVLTIALLVTRRVLGSYGSDNSADGGKPTEISSQFKKFQLNFLVVYLIMMCTPVSIFQDY